MRVIKFHDKTDEKFTEARTLIWKVSQQDPEAGEKMHKSFMKCFETMLCFLHNMTLEKDEYGYEKETGVLEIYPDFVQGSFGFNLTKEGSDRRGFNGGMILHGMGEETFSVSLSSEKHPYFAIHT